MSDSIDHEDALRQQHAFIEDTLAAYEAKEEALLVKLEVLKKEKQPFEEAEQRIRGEIKKSLSDRYGDKANDNTVNKSQGVAQDKTKKPEQSRGPISKKQAEELEAKVAKLQPTPGLTPPGFPKPVQGDRDRKAAKLAREIRDDLANKAGEAKEAFDQSVSTQVNLPRGKGRGR